MLSGSMRCTLSLLLHPLKSLTSVRAAHTLGSVDLLYDHLMRARATGAVFARTVIMPPWGLRLGGSIQLAVHAVTRGKAWLWLDDPAGAVELRPGEIALVRGGSAHYIAHEPGADCLGPGDFRAQHRQSVPNAGPAATVFLCGAYQFSGDIASGLLDALPRVLMLSSAIDEPLRDVIKLLSRELTTVEPGQQTVLDRLLDVLLVLALRSDFRRSATAPRWYRASADPRLHAALQAMHEDASHPWTVPDLAAISGLSRSAFARAFRDALGQAPLQYLTEWRMTLARDHLRTGELSLARIAAGVGYGSPYAFAAAFRSHHGIPPGAWRQQQSAAPLTLNGAEDPAARAEPDEELGVRAPASGRRRGKQLVDEDVLQPSLVPSGGPGPLVDEQSVDLGRHERVDDVRGVALCQLLPQRPGTGQGRGDLPLALLPLSRVLRE
jgi:AraC-like DNA-binding protein